MNSGYYDFDYVEEYPTDEPYVEDTSQTPHREFWQQLKESYLSRCRDQGLKTFANYLINFWLESRKYPDPAACTTDDIKLYVVIPNQFEITRALGITRHMTDKYLDLLLELNIGKRSTFQSNDKKWNKETNDFVRSKSNNPILKKCRVFRLYFDRSGIVPPKEAEYPAAVALLTQIHSQFESNAFSVKDVFDLAITLKRRIPKKRRKRTVRGQHQALSWWLDSLNGQEHGGFRMDFVGIDPHSNLRQWRVTKIAPLSLLETSPIGVTKKQALNHYLEVWLTQWKQENPRYALTARELVALFKEATGHEVGPVVMGRMATKVLGPALHSRTERTYVSQDDGILACDRCEEGRINHICHTTPSCQVDACDRSEEGSATLYSI